MKDKRMNTPKEHSKTWPIVVDFSERMERKLDLNRRKGDAEGWRCCQWPDLLARLREEVEELELAMAVSDVRSGESTENANDAANGAANEAADVANFAMMLADWHLERMRRRLEP
jgi:hypothetical protein